MALTIIVTDAGRAALVNAANNGTNPVIIAQTGISATAVVPSTAATALPDEIKRIDTVSGDVVADDMIHLVVRDEGSDTFTVRSFGLYLADGTLFAIYGQANPILEKSAQAMMLLAIDIVFADVNAAEISFGDANFLNPPATETVAGVIELASEQETIAGALVNRAVHPKGLKGAVTSWLNDRFGEGAPSAFMKSLLTTASAAALRIAIGLKGAALKDEGAGNGLDADLLDGQHGSYYSDVPARLGFVPWGPSNDGAGSGLDADLLDGQQGSYYANVTARLGYTPWGPNNDGAESGLDADLLDGQQGSWYSNISARLGYTPVNRAGDTMTGPLRVTATVTPFISENLGWTSGYIDMGGFLQWNGSGARTEFAVLHISTNHVALEARNQSNVKGTLCLQPYGGWVTIGQGNTAWHAGNDGSGSGLDADMLDGYHANAFLRLESNTRLQQDRGYLLYANGLKETWGEIVINANSAGYWEYPVGFSSWVHPQISVTVVNGEDNASQVTGITSVGLGGIWVYTASNSAVRIYIRIIGV